MNADGSELRELSRAAAVGSGTVVSWEGPAWSPDGTRIAVARLTFTPSGGDRPYPDEIDRLLVIDAETGAEVEVDLGPDFFWGSLSWAPDGRSLLVDKAPSTGGLFLVDLATGETSSLPWAAQDSPSWQRLAGD